MPLRQSAGVLLFRRSVRGVEVLLVHPGGPFWRRKDEGAWSIPKGEFLPDEEPIAAARREFHEELGSAAGPGEYVPLESVKQSGKVVFGWALEGDFDLAGFKSNTFSMEWPPKSGNQREFPEVDRAGWFSVDAARIKILKAQEPFLDRLLQLLSQASSQRV